MRKRFSQVFLVKKKIAEKMVETMKVKKGEWVIEVGPGKGILTRELIKKARVLAIEIDRELYERLKREIIDLDFFILHQDVLKTDFSELFREYGISQPVLLSNLPYHITTPFIEKVIENKEMFKELYLTLQKEVVNRLTGKPGTKDYSSLTIFVNYFMETESIMPIPRFFFRPVPRVSSIFIRMKPRKKPLVDTENEKLFFQVVRQIFKHRRKQLKNVLSPIFSQKILHKIGESYNLNVRGEKLKPEDFAEIADIAFREK